MKKSPSGFTLMEILTVIAIIGVIALGTSRINFNSINDKQKSQIFAQKLIGRIQTIRNYSVTGYGVESTLYTPKEWRVEVGLGSGGIITSYLDGGGVRRENTTTSYILATGEFVQNIRCINYFNTGTYQDLAGTGYILFSSGGTSFPSCPNSSYNLLQIQARGGRLSTTIEINGMNALIQSL